MKKYAIAFMTAFMSALTVMVLVTEISKALIEIPNFLIGWFSCMGWYLGKEIQEFWSLKENK